MGEVIANYKYRGENLSRVKVPERCMRNGKACAWRMRCSNGSLRIGEQTACGYMYYTGHERGCDAENCTRYIAKFPAFLTVQDNEYYEIFPDEE